MSELDKYESTDQSTEIANASKNRFRTGLLSILFIVCSFLVLNVGGYNSFIPLHLILVTRATVTGIFLIATLILYQSKGVLNKYWKVSFSFLIASIGLLFAWVFGRWYTLIPGLSASTVEGAAVAKIAEVLPIVLCILVGLWMVERDFAPLYLHGGDVRRSIKLGIVVSPAALFPFIVLGGLGLSASLATVFSWLPWICAFAFSNALMEELMIRGLFLREYGSF
ncbi:MAG: hypothetical protein ACFFCP_17675, partial [Promethearchaeota archaeon]